MLLCRFDLVGLQKDSLVGFFRLSSSFVLVLKMWSISDWCLLRYFKYWHLILLIHNTKFTRPPNAYFNFFYIDIINGFTESKLVIARRLRSMCVYMFCFIPVKYYILIDYYLYFSKTLTFKCEPIFFKREEY